MYKVSLKNVGADMVTREVVFGCGMLSFAEFHTVDICKEVSGINDLELVLLSPVEYAVQSDGRTIGSVTIVKQ